MIHASELAPKLGSCFNGAGPGEVRTRSSVCDSAGTCEKRCYTLRDDRN